MEELIVFGNGNISKILSKYLEKKYQIIAYVSFKKFVKSKNFNGRPLIIAENIKKKFSPKNYKFIIAVGYLGMNSVRSKIYKFIRSKGYKFTNYIDESVYIPTGTKIGENNFLLEKVSINPECSLGNGNVIWSNSVISHNVKLNNFNWISSGSVISGDTSIGNCNFFGSNSTISNNCKIGNNNFIGARTLISGKILSKNTIIESKSKKLEIKSIDYLNYLRNER